VRASIPILSIRCGKRSIDGRIGCAVVIARAAADRCEVIELLDPRTDLCDEIDGLYCRTRKGKFMVNLPLVELTVLPPSKNLELLADYEYWFWHWRD
jgi:hypothetical protein